MRVALRRLRSTLRAFRPLLDQSRTEPLRAELRWLSDLLGPVRDGQVLAQRLAEAIAAEPPELVVGPVAARIRQRLAATAARARADLVEGISSDRFSHLVAAVADAAGSGPQDVSEERLRRRARRSVRRADRLLDDAMSAGSDQSSSPSQLDNQLHAARRAYKRARYAVELIQPLWDLPARRLVRRIKELQDLLGEHQDAIVAEQTLRDFGIRAHLDGENGFTYGLLLARQRGRTTGTIPGLTRATRRLRKTAYP
jgi:CHAD domain-containing protein